MKKSVLTIIFCLLCFSAFTQTRKLLIGINAGPSYTYMYGNDVFKKNQKPTIGYLGGFSFHYYFNKRMSVLLQVGYEKKGTYTNITLPTQDAATKGYYKIHFNYNYLMTPVLFSYSFGNKIKYFINAGPMVGYLLFQQTRTKSNVMKIDDQYLTTSFKRWDFGISGGVGVMLPITERLTFSVAIQNNTGLKSLNRYTIENNGKVKTLSNTLSFGLYYQIGHSVNTDTNINISNVD